MNLGKLSSNLPSNIQKYTSNEGKIFSHPKQIANFLKGDGHSIVTAHIAPTNKCNLNCSYCNQANRDKVSELSLETIKNFLSMLKERGLKAVVITGGGEPTTYPDFNKLLRWIKDNKLLAGLVTNGTNDLCGGEKITNWGDFKWIRTSINFDKNNKMRPIKIPGGNGNVGLSLVHSKEQPQSVFNEVKTLADKLRAQYVRIIPDCCQSVDDLKKEQEILSDVIRKLDDPRFFVQQKLPEQATLAQCHKSKLRPFLLPTGEVAPCDCFMMNMDKNGKQLKGFQPKFNLCSDPKNPMSYADYLDGKFTPQFNPIEDCNGCSFTESNKVLQELIDLNKANPNKKVEELFKIMGNSAYMDPDISSFL